MSRDLEYVGTGRAEKPKLDSNKDTSPRAIAERMAQRIHATEVCSPREARDKANEIVRRNIRKQSDER